jgi:hypothetical protein
VRREVTRFQDGSYLVPGICGDRGRCGKDKGELDPDGKPHAVHVQYDAGGQILATWWSNDHYEGQAG